MDLFFFGFFFVLFSPSTPVILRLLTSFSFFSCSTLEGRRLLIHTRIHRDAGGDDPQAPRVDISTTAAPFLVSPRAQLLRHYFSREGPGIFAANSSSTATILLLQTTTALVRHPSIHLACESRQKKEKPDSPFQWIYFYPSSFLMRRT